MLNYLIRDLPHKVERNMSRFRTSSHYLKVETDRWKRPIVPWKDRVCHLSDYGTVQDEHHVVFECTDEALLDSRRKYQSLISQSENKMIPLHYLMCNPEVEGREKLPLFIHECMKRLDQLFYDRFEYFFTVFSSRTRGILKIKCFFVRVNIFW